MVSPACPALANARTSVEIASPVARHSVRLKAQLEVTGCGNDVDAGVAPLNDTPTLFAMPCSASCHHCCGDTPARGAPPDAVDSINAFSSKDSRPTRSATRASSGAPASQKGRPAPSEPGSHALKREPASTHSPDGVCVSAPAASEKACAAAPAAHGASASIAPGSAGAPGASATQSPEPSASAIAGGASVTGKAEPHGDA